MKILHTIHAVGEYTQLQQNVHEFAHNDLMQAYNDINEFSTADRITTLDPFTVANEHGIFTSCPVVTESYVVIG